MSTITRGPDGGLSIQSKAAATQVTLQSFIARQRGVQNEDNDRLREFLKQPGRVHFFGMATMAGMGEAVRNLEMAHYHPRTRANDNFHMRLITQGPKEAWAMLSMPEADFDRARPFFEAQGLLLSQNNDGQVLLPSAFRNVNIWVVYTGPNTHGRTMMEMSGDVDEQLLLDLVNGLDPVTNEPWLKTPEEKVIAGNLVRHIRRMPPKDRVEAVENFEKTLKDPGISYEAKRAMLLVDKATLKKHFEDGRGDFLPGTSLDDYLAYQQQGGTDEKLIGLPVEPGSVRDDLRNADRRIMSDCVYFDFRDWVKRNGLNGLSQGRVVLQRPNGSFWHKLIEAARSKKVYSADAKKDMQLLTSMEKTAQVFLVEHDWAAAFKGAHDFDAGEFRLPYDQCVFEFRIDGKRLCALIGSDQPEAYLLFLEGIDGTWLCLGFGTGDPKDKLDVDLAVWHSMRAVCIALEADVAETSSQEPPRKLNEARAKKGKVPLRPFHVVALRARHRRDRNPDAVPTGRRVRCHFRRGHWRHYHDREEACTHRWQTKDQSERSHCSECPAWRTWTPWMLVGDPDLGFVDKYYKL